MKQFGRNTKRSPRQRGIDEAQDRGMLEVRPALGLGAPF
jgi:hypothetical protein